MFYFLFYQTIYKQTSFPFLKSNFNITRFALEGS